MSNRPRLILCSADSAQESAQLAQRVLLRAQDEERPSYLLRLGSESSELWRLPWWELLRLVSAELGWPSAALGPQPPDSRVVPWIPGVDEVLAALLAGHLSEGDDQATEPAVVVDCGPDLLRWLLWLADAERGLLLAMQEATLGSQGQRDTQGGLMFEPGTLTPAQVLVQNLRQARRALARAEVDHAGDPLQGFLISLHGAPERGGTVISSPDSVTWHLSVPNTLAESTDLEVGLVDELMGARIVVCAAQRSITLALPAALQGARLLAATLSDGRDDLGPGLALHFAGIEGSRWSDAR